MNIKKVVSITIMAYAALTASNVYCAANSKEKKVERVNKMRAVESSEPSRPAGRCCFCWKKKPKLTQFAPSIKHVDIEQSGPSPFGPSMQSRYQQTDSSLESAENDAYAADIDDDIDNGAGIGKPAPI